VLCICPPTGISLYLPAVNEALLKNRRICDLVEQDLEMAQVLYHFGIRFYEHGNQTLEQVCHLCGLRVEQLVRELETPRTNFHEEDVPLFSYPIDLILEYLKHAHFLFVKHKLPYIGKLVENFKAHHADYDQVERDLKTLYPLFLEDFIHHIYEEEDTLFKYIQLLQRALKGNYNPCRLYQQMEKNSLQSCAIEHEVHDDEMAGIRKITKDYYLTPDAPLHVKVIYAELIGFEKTLQVHARIENEILFPKAMALENQVKKVFLEKVKLN
jgi:regulator of cell morphogenesis and NO signaling